MNMIFLKEKKASDIRVISTNKTIIINRECACVNAEYPSNVEWEYYFLEDVEKIVSDGQVIFEKGELVF